MRITKLPIPLLIAAAALTSVAVIYVYLTAPPMPIHTDPNFTSPLFAGGTYLWRGAAFEYIISADNTISVAYGAPHHLIYLTGPLSNITVLTDKAWIVYAPGERPLYIIHLRVYRPPFNWWEDAFLVYKLTDVTPENVSIPRLTVWLPKTFDGLNDELTKREEDVLRAVVPRASLFSYRVIGMEVNATHITFKMAWLRGAYYEDVGVYPLSSSTSGRTIRVTNSPVSTGYSINGTTYTLIALPYQYFAITPTETANVVIYVR